MLVGVGRGEDKDRGVRYCAVVYLAFARSFSGPSPVQEHTAEVAELLADEDPGIRYWAIEATLKGGEERLKGGNGSVSLRRPWRTRALPVSRRAASCRRPSRPFGQRFRSRWRGLGPPLPPGGGQSCGARDAGLPGGGGGHLGHRPRGG